MFFNDVIRTFSALNRSSQTKFRNGTSSLLVSSSICSSVYFVFAQSAELSVQSEKKSCRESDSNVVRVYAHQWATVNVTTFAFPPVTSPNVCCAKASGILLYDIIVLSVRVCVQYLLLSVLVLPWKIPIMHRHREDDSKGLFLLCW